MTYGYARSCPPITSQVRCRSLADEGNRSADGPHDSLGLTLDLPARRIAADLPCTPNAPGIYFSFDPPKGRNTPDRE